MRVNMNTIPSSKASQFHPTYYSQCNVSSSPNIAIHFDTFDQLIQQSAHVKRQFIDHGFVILSPQKVDDNLLLKTCRLFGKIQGHARDNSNGIVEIRSGSSGTSNKVVISKLGLKPHTDGVYLDGIAIRNNVVHRVGPPKIVALQCIKPATQGGTNILVDGKPILHSIIKNDKKLFAFLLSRQTIMVRDQHLVMNFPILDILPNGNFSFRFSYDQDLYTSYSAKKCLDLFNQNYVLNPKFATYQNLKEKQILFFDNQRLFHGRKPIEGDRFFKRVWIQDENLSQEMIHVSKEENVSPSSGSSSAIFDKFHVYLGIDSIKDENQILKMNTGIRLSPSLMRFCRKFIPFMNEKLPSGLHQN